MLTVIFMEFYLFINVKFSKKVVYEVVLILLVWAGDVDAIYFYLNLDAFIFKVMW